MRSVVRRLPHNVGVPVGGTGVATGSRWLLFIQSPPFSDRQRHIFRLSSLQLSPTYCTTPRNTLVVECAGLPSLVWRLMSTAEYCVMRKLEMP